VVGAGTLGQRARQHLGDPPPTPPGDLKVVHGAAGIRLGVALVRQAPPRLVGARQGRLYEVFRQVLIAGEQIRRAQQGVRAGPDKGIELVVCAIHAEPPRSVEELAGRPQIRCVEHLLRHRDS
jgi:hypothetical protein